MAGGSWSACGIGERNGLSNTTAGLGEKRAMLDEDIRALDVLPPSRVEFFIDVSGFKSSSLSWLMTRAFFSR